MTRTQFIFRTEKKNGVKGEEEEEEEGVIQRGIRDKKGLFLSFAFDQENDDFHL